MDTGQWITLLTAIGTLFVTIFVVIKQGEIQKTVQEHDTRFTYLHQHRGKVIGELYRLIVDVRVYLEASFSGFRLAKERTPQEQWEKVENSLAKFLDYYRKNRLFLNQNLCDLIDQALKTLLQVAANKEIAESIQPTRLWSDPLIADQVKNLDDEARKKVDEVLVPILERIEQEMREILDPNSEQ